MHGENHEDYRRFSMEKGQGIQMEKMEDYFLSECKSDFLHYEAEIQEKNTKLRQIKISYLLLENYLLCADLYIKQKRRLSK